ncbi:MAG: transcription-repair coupling factor, partial [Treponema sp.]|nr:transcription-repair coupling factor [Treponema sp.]
MDSLSFPGLISLIDKSKPLAACVSALQQGKFPLIIHGAEGAFTSMLLARLFMARPGVYFVVVPQETDAADLSLDLAAPGRGDFAVPCRQFPWWGSVPYRELAPLSAVFGERVSVLSDIVLQKPGIIIIPERALLTPLPPPEYIK